MPADMAVNAYVLLRELEARLGEMIQTALVRANPGRNFIDFLSVEIQIKLRTETGVSDYSRAT
jgi:hypothetical protein